MNYFKVASVVLIVIFSVHGGFAHEGHDEVYTGCELETADTIPQIEDGLCVIRAKACKENGNSVSVPAGHYMKLSCDATPQFSRELPSRIGCPTDPNDCANDQKNDGTREYNGITWILTADWGDLKAGEVLVRESDNIQRGSNNRRSSSGVQ